MINHILSRMNRLAVSMSAGHLRLGLAVISLFALVLGGSASAHWD